jgi:dihydroorotate dehydrogenase (NAD+) catalytic subunit
MDGVMDRRVSLGRLELPNPVMNASGTFGYGHEWPALTRTAELGAIVTKTLTRAPRPGNPPPRLHETPAGMLNSIGLENVGVEAFRRDALPALRALGPPVIASLGGSEVEDYAACARILDGAGPAAFEINISCPNVACGGMAFGRDPADAARVVRAVRAVTALPLLVKLTPTAPDLVAVGRACLAEGADALTAVNTFPGMAIDVARERPVFARVSAGLSGPAVRPLVLYRVWELARELRCPIVASGGIATAHDALEFLLAGASAVQIGTALLCDPARAARVLEGLEARAREKGVTRIADLVGRAQAAPGPDAPSGARGGRHGP